MGAVVVDAVQRPTRLRETPQGVTQSRSSRVEDRDVVQPSGAGRWGRTALRFPRVEAKVVVIAAGGQEQGVLHAKDHVKPEDLDIEVVDAIDVRRLEMDMSDPCSRSDWARGAFARRDAGGSLSLDF